MLREVQLGDPPQPAAGPVAELLVAYFCRLADTIGLPRSVAQIYAVLFLAPDLLSFAEIVEQAHLSKGSASTGLRNLRRLRGVEVVIRPSDRRTFYRPETSLRRLLDGFLAESVVPGLAAGDRLLDDARAAAENPATPEHLRARIETLRAWHDRASDLLPLLHSLRPT